MSEETTSAEPELTTKQKVATTVTAIAVSVAVSLAASAVNDVLTKRVQSFIVPDKK